MYSSHGGKIQLCNLDPIDLAIRKATHLGVLKDCRRYPEVRFITPASENPRWLAVSSQAIGGLSSKVSSS